MSDTAELLKDALYSGYIDGTQSAKQVYKPKLLLNDPVNGTKVLSNILSELENCEEFMFSVAFITNSGVAVLINTLKELEAKGVKGKILTSQYQNFTQPEALRRLLKLTNIELRIQVENNFHAKGYLFKHANDYTLIIGSSNLTANALEYNNEWNLKVSALERGSIRDDISNEFERQFSMATVVDDSFLQEYEKIYGAERAARKVSAENVIDIGGSFVPKPNRMQVEALNALENLRGENRNRALLISATGTGKTYLSAFDAKKFNPRRLLFVIHRENIARKAMATFKKVYGAEKSMGLYTGSAHEADKDFLFCTVQTISKPEHYQQFDPKEFDYIIVDEVHHAGADTYQSILNYFKPKFLLGMSATPERTDGYDIFKAFDYNIAYELRLHDALELDMLSPFHYYGVKDVTVNGEIISDDAAFNMLTCEERVDNIIRNAELYGCDRGRVKGLIFCSRVNEAIELEEKLNARGLKVKALVGANNEAEREASMELLESDDPTNYLDYIVTVDIFNEGVDIPSVNQVLMLRPTQSAIIFVQQLGRGLRKAEEKEFLTVIDFIGNYQNNFLIPIALYGDRSYNKDNIRKLLAAGSSLIPGPSSINFDPVCKQKIYDAIDRTNISTYKDLKNDYRLMKYKLGHIPCMCDFLEHGSRDPFSFVAYSGSFYSFLCKVEPDLVGTLNIDEMQLLSYLSKEVCNAKRLEEPLILKALIESDSISSDRIQKMLADYNLLFIEASIESAINVINGQFMIAAARKSYRCVDLVEMQGRCIKRTQKLSQLLGNKNFKHYLSDSVEYAIATITKKLEKSHPVGGFIRYEKYSRKDVCRILNWPSNEEATVYGYQVKYGTCPIFVNYEKEDTVKGSSTDYADYFINQQTFHWMTRHNKTLQSSECVKIKAQKENDLRICLFVKKHNGEGDDFYYIGDLSPLSLNQTTIKNEKTGAVEPIVNINYTIDEPLEENLYNYLVAKDEA